jgi:CheY-like chemotaxis protein
MTDTPLVLVVEDEALLALEIEDLLLASGFAARLAGDGQAALAQSTEALAAAVVDLNLGSGLQGREVIRLLRQRRPALPVVVVTGYMPQAVQADLRGLGGPTARLHKPVDPTRLLQRLRDAIKSKNGIA